MAIHQGVIFGALTLVTGSIWASSAGATGGTWSEDQLVLFLVLFLFYCAYFMLRFSVARAAAREPERGLRAVRRRADPGQLLAIRLSRTLHPPGRVQQARAEHGGSQFFTFCVALAAMLTLAATCTGVELAGKRLDARLRELREALQ